MRKATWFDVFAVIIMTILIGVWFNVSKNERISGSFFVGALIGAYTRELFRVNIQTRFYNYVWLFAFILGFTVLGCIL